MLYSCKPIFEKIKAQVGAEIDSFPIEDPPTVCIITTGEDEPSTRYVRTKLKDFGELGIEADVKRFDTIYDLLCFMLSNGVQSDYDGIIVQRPTLVSDAPPKEAAAQVAAYMRPYLDIDGIAQGSPFVPPPVRGLDLLLQEWGYDPSGKTAVVIGRGDVGRPVAEYLLSRDATVTVCHSKTPPETMIKAMRESDILVGAAGLKVPIMSLVKSADSVVIDYGITKGEDGKLHGDFQSGLAQYYKYHTAVPGGMGLMVRAGLLLNIVDAHKRRRLDGLGSVVTERKPL